METHQVLKGLKYVAEVIESQTHEYEQTRKRILELNGAIFWLERRLFKLLTPRDKFEKELAEGLTVPMSQEDADGLDAMLARLRVLVQEAKHYVRFLELLAASESTYNNMQQWLAKHPGGVMLGPQADPDFKPLLAFVELADVSKDRIILARQRLAAARELAFEGQLGLALDQLRVAQELTAAFGKMGAAVKAKTLIGVGSKTVQ